MVTLRDVAKEAGVSAATASLALNNSDKVNIDTLKKVQKIARELNYIPDARAKALTKKSTKIIGLVVPEINNPFFADLAQAIKMKLNESDYSIILCGTQNDPKEEKKYIDMFRSGMVDGAIFTCLTEVNNSFITELASNHIPVVYIDRIGDDGGIIPIVKSNLKDGGYQITRHLIKLGHKKIAYIGRKDEERYAGFKDAMLEFGCEINKDYIFDKYHAFESGVKAGFMLNNLEDKPTGIICFNDETAIGLMQTLIKFDFNIPKDFSVCGIDNIDVAKYYSPSLTTIDIPKKKMGKKAAEILLKLIAGKEVEKEDYFINYQVKLIERDSSSKLE
ncbi:LacI family transcriptional regulator [Orenia metallireducens]|jgi:LacI family transcriptional regulator|uniref:Transcriptional regulator, LacI family n=1 Tax=Orenia metallireducens TaxID=1413210 RepID=A0A285H7L9_9FIRM|nr:LacI family DNA-binding transcriptional regulator [Orenia metallireducens]PRX28588.1 LacI family transcriptional regulator [Orenia metallireducens]SNY30611.1 transcriptional regulator, LacI family [Orenia metallireducens]